MSRRIILSAGFCLLCNFLFSQSSSWSSTDYTYACDQMQFKSQRVIPPSPDAAELGKYGNIPVSLFTGTPNISIPLYDLKGNHLHLPITLSYNHSGFKPQEIASWIGLGWTLQAGGVVTRSVIGNPDKNTNYFFSNNHYGTPPVVNNLYATYDYMDSIRRNINETQPDVYYYNFNGHSGKFLLTPDQVVIRKDKNNLKITSNGIPWDATGVSNITIVDEQGNKYLFGATEISTTQLDDGTTQGGSSVFNFTYPSSWYLSSITSADNQEQILFNYYTADSAQVQYGNYLQNRSITYSRAASSISTASYDGLVSNNLAAPPVVTLLNRKYLQSLTYTKGGQTVITIQFESVLDQRQDLSHSEFPQERMLSDIKVYFNNILTKQYNFFTSYFTNSIHLDYDHRRLRLDSLQEVAIDGSGQVKPVYSFTYNNKSVPSTSQPGIDHWGFFNGGDVVTSLVPNYSTGDGNAYGGGANRDPDSAGSLTTLLNQINYPTGGYTIFTYEMNHGKDPSTGIVQPVGGMRIKSIADYSFNGTTATVKNYLYMLSDGTTSGITYTPFYMKTSGFLSSKSASSTFSYMRISASSVAGLGTFQGSHIGYSQVTEYQTDISNNIPLGKTVYKYNIANINPQDDNISIGDLLETSVYDNNGKMLSDELNTYTYPPGDGGLVGVTVAPAAGQDDKSVLCQSSQGGYSWLNPSDPTTSCTSTRTYVTKYAYSSYAVIGQYRQLSTVVRTTYDLQSNSYSTITRKFTYGGTNHTYPTLIEQTSSSNDEIVTSKKYAGDYSVPGSGTLDGATQAIQLLQSNNMLGTEIETCQYRQNTDGTNKRYIGGLLNFYFPTSPYVQNIYRLEMSAPMTALQTSSTNGTFTYDAAYKPLGSFSYDSYGNISEQSKSQDAVKAYIWDYVHFLPTAEVVNANANMIAYTGFESGGTGGNWSGYNVSSIATGGVAGSGSYNLTSTAQLVRSVLPATRQYVVSYWINSGSVTVTTDIGTAAGTAGASYNGWTYYEHLLPAGSTQATVSSATTAKIDELRLFPTDALMTTYDYKPWVGMDGQCAANNLFTFYDYDGFGRVVNIRDISGNIIKNFKYNYGLGAPITPASQTLFYSAQKQGSYAKTGCPVGTLPDTVTYTVPFAAYVSAINQSDADSKATADVTANGQTNANTKGLCRYWNVDEFQRFSKNDCPASGGGSQCSLTGPGHLQGSILYDVPAHTYSSTVDQTTANNLALADIAANGQNYANKYCWCSCGGEGQKMINGTCTTGTRYNSSSTQMPDGTYKCTYYYVFSDGTTSQFYYSYGPTPCPVH